MANDMFLKLDGVEGEAQDAFHRNEIDVLAWSWGCTQSGTTHMGSGGGGGKVSVQDISVTKYIDSSSHSLMKKCFSGEHISSGTLVVRKAGGDDPLEYLIIELEDIIVSSISTGGAKLEEGRLTESISLNFSVVNYKYTPQESNGSGGAEKIFGWKIAENIEK